MSIGATAKSTTVFNYCGIDNSIIDVITDTTIDKQNTYSPGAHIPVVSPDKVNMIDYDYQNLQIASIQIYESLKWAKNTQLKFLDIGVSQLYQGNKIIPHESLINFKEQFGAQAMIRKVMKLKL